MRKLKYLGVFLSLFTAVMATAQDNDMLSLDKLLNEYPNLKALIKESKKNNLEIKSAKKSTASAIAESEAAVANWYPSFWFNSSVTRSKKYTVGQDDEVTSYLNNVNMAQPIWDYDIHYDTKIASSLATQFKWSQLSIENQVAFNVLATYFNYVTQVKNQESYKTIIKNVKKRYDTVEAEVQLGKKLKVDLLEVKAQLLEKEYDLVKSKNDAEKALELLALLVNRKVEEKTLARKEIDLLKLPSPAKLVELSRKRNPEILIARESEAAENYKYKQLNDEFIPKLYLSGSYGFSSDGDIEFGEEEEDARIGVGLTWEFGDLTRSLRKLAVLSKREAITEQKKYLEKRIPNDIITSSLELKSLAANLDSLERRISQLAELYRMRQEQYRNGTVSITDLSIAEDDLLEARLEFVEAKSLYNITSMQLWVFSGGENSL